MSIFLDRLRIYYVAQERLQEGVYTPLIKIKREQKSLANFSEVVTHHYNFSSLFSSYHLKKVFICTHLFLVYVHYSSLLYFVKV